MVKQLYRFIKDIEFPNTERVDGTTGEIFFNSIVMPGYYSMVWPNGIPCLIAEMYLQDKSWLVKVSKRDGGTLGNYARNISHLIRFCFVSKIDFCDLTHENIDGFVQFLCSEKNTDNTRVRDNNTVKKIVSNSIDFIIWIQENIASDRRIAGVDTRENRYQIKLKEEFYASPKGYSSSHQVFPIAIPKAIKSIMHPISSLNIKRLWSTLSETKSTAQVNNKLNGKFSRKQQADHIEYMFKRRELQLILLEATGLRPQELITTECSSNIKYLSESRMSIPTLKGRKDSLMNKRLIPIPRSVAIKVELFISVYREKLIKRLLLSGLISSKEEVDDVIYLNSETGKMVLPDAAYQEFRRLTVRAGITQKNCQSMFRHRFITNMVKLHLIGFMDKNPLKNRQLMTDNDYRTILKKVASFTGHKSLDSLLHYIDIAWEELNAFSYTYEVKELQERLKSIFYTANSLKAELGGISTKKATQNDLFTINKLLLEIENLSSAF